MSYNEYISNKAAGRVSIAKQGDEVVYKMRRWNSDTGEEIEATAKVITLVELRGHRAALVSAIAQLDAMIADLRNVAP